MHTPLTNGAVSRSASRSAPSAVSSFDGGFLTPRVIDQNAFDELASTLRDLIDQAARMHDGLKGEMEQLTSRELEVSDASKTLQERLRLSARMLQAFQSQINHVESSLTRIEQFEKRVESATQRMNDALEDLDSRIDATISGAATRLGELVDDAVHRFVRQAEARQEALAGRGPQIETLLERADAMIAAGEQAEVNIAQAAWRFAQVRRDMDTASAEAARATAYSESTSRRLQDELLERTSRVDELAERAERLHTALQAELDPVEEAVQHLRTERDAASESLRTLREGQALAAEVRAAMAELEPWQRWLQPTKGDDGEAATVEPPEPIAHLVAGVRQRLGQELTSFSTALRAAAGQLDEVGR